LLESQGFRLLLDIGSGSLGPLQKHIDPRDIDALFLTHLHGDHWLDLVPLSHARTHHPDGRKPKPLRVIAPIGERPRIEGAFGKPVERLDEVFVFENTKDGTVGPFDVTTIRARHPVEAYAIRATADGASVVYTGDTASSAKLTAFAKGADLLLAEAGFVDGVDNPDGVHLTASQTGLLAKAAGARRLVVTHVMPWDDARAQCDAARTAFGGPTELAAPGRSYDVVGRR
jgi:ribonuclease BN (tRNA processing enzyme)